jgi:hypothetical protein
MRRETGLLGEFFAKRNSEKQAGPRHSRCVSPRTSLVTGIASCIPFLHRISLIL